ncbi:LOW QUALITY PROTEIN: hypothetical protein QTO34_016340 [Cnephaeus nilssonii]|nr:LOW QUALITY PROTEIN: hypothetical protein QTO34_016340 [Eptesicus nilssonii]
MAAAQDVHVRICNQEIVKFDLEVKALIQELEQSAKEQDKESDKQVLLQEVENHKKQMLSNQTSWRKANLTCKIAIDNLEKAELLQGGDLLRQRKTAKENLAQTSSTITENLMGISRVMSQQVQQSEEAMQTLVTSSRTILDANEEFKSMSGTIQLGRKLITKYNRRELTDKLLIFLALALFLATVLYIVKKRLFPFLADNCRRLPFKLRCQDPAGLLSSGPAASGPSSPEVQVLSRSDGDAPLRVLQAAAS